MTKVVGSFLIKFGFVIDIGFKLFKVLTQKMTDLVRKNCFYNVYFDLTLITLIVKVKNAPKFRVMFLDYLSKDPESFIKLS